MGRFVCDECSCIENTALGEYLETNDKHDDICEKIHIYKEVRKKRKVK